MEIMIPKKAVKVLSIVTVILGMIAYVEPSALTIVKNYFAEKQAMAVLETKGAEVDKIDETSAKAIMLALKTADIASGMEYNIKDGLFVASLAHALSNAYVDMRNYSLIGSESSNGITVDTLQIEFQGNYNNAMNVISYLENLEAFTQIQDISIVRADKVNANTSLVNGDVNVKLTLAIYSNDKADKRLSAPKYIAGEYGKTNPFMAQAN